MVITNNVSFVAILERLTRNFWLCLCVCVYVCACACKSNSVMCNKNQQAWKYATRKKLFPSCHWKTKQNLIFHVLLWAWGDGGVHGKPLEVNICLFVCFGKVIAKYAAYWKVCAKHWAARRGENETVRWVKEALKVEKVRHCWCKISNM